METYFRFWRVSHSLISAAGKTQHAPSPRRTLPCTARKVQGFGLHKEKIKQPLCLCSVLAAENSTLVLSLDQLMLLCSRRECPTAAAAVLAWAIKPLMWVQTNSVTFPLL